MIPNLTPRPRKDHIYFYARLLSIADAALGLPRKDHTFALSLSLSKDFTHS